MLQYLTVKVNIRSLSLNLALRVRFYVVKRFKPIRLKSCILQTELAFDFGTQELTFVHETVGNTAFNPTGVYLTLFSLDGTELVTKLSI